MATFLYVEKPSMLHRLHPAAKVVAMVLVFAAAMAFTDPLQELPVLALAVVILWAANGLGNLRRVWKFCAVIFVATTLVWALFQRGLGEPGEYQPITWSRPSFIYGLAMGLRINAFLIAGLALLSSTRTEEFTAGLRTLRLPQMMALAFSLAFRLVPTFAATAGTVIQAQRSRGHDVAGGGLIRRIRASIPLVVPVLAYALRNAGGLSMALEAKGLGARPDRTRYLQFRVRSADVVAVGLMAVVAAVCLGIRQAPRFHEKMADAALREQGYVILEQSVRDPGQAVEVDVKLMVPRVCYDSLACRFGAAVRNVENANGDDWMEQMAFVLRVEGDEREEHVVRLPVPEDIVVGTSRARRAAIEKDPSYAGMRWIEPAAEQPTAVLAAVTELPPGEYTVSFAYRYTDASHTDVADRLAREVDLPGVTVTVAAAPGGSTLRVSL